MIYNRLRDSLPAWLSRWVMHFEARIAEELRAFSQSLPANARVLDAGAGEAKHRPFFAKHRYTGVDLAIGDQRWDYSRIDAVADLEALPFRDSSFDAAINIVTLEHVRRPAKVLAEIARVLKTNGTLLIVVPLEWEVHQAPHDYFRYTRHGLEMLLIESGLRVERLQPVGGIFRVLSRRMLNSMRVTPVAALLAPLAVLLPALDGLDSAKESTPGYVCIARK